MLMCMVLAQVASGAWSLPSLVASWPGGPAQHHSQLTPFTSTFDESVYCLCWCAIPASRLLADCAEQTGPPCRHKAQSLLTPGQFVRGRPVYGEGDVEWLQLEVRGMRGRGRLAWSDPAEVHLHCHGVLLVYFCFLCIPGSPSMR